MNRSQIESASNDVLVQASKTDPLDLDDLISGSKPSYDRQPAQMIDLYAEASPAVLAGILKINVSLIYQYRQNGKLPPNSTASYRDCIYHYVTYYKNAAVVKSTSLTDADLEQRILLNRAKTEGQLWENMKTRKELIDVKLLAERFEPYFVNVRSGLHGLARKFPEAKETINKLLLEWNEVGKGLLEKTDQQLAELVQEQLEEKLDLPGASED